MKKGSKYFIMGSIVAFLVAGAVLVGNFCGNRQDEIDRTVHKYAPTGASIAIIEQGKIKEIMQMDAAKCSESRSIPKVQGELMHWESYQDTLAMEEPYMSIMEH